MVNQTKPTIRRLAWRRDNLVFGTKAYIVDTEKRPGVLKQHANPWEGTVLPRTESREIERLAAAERDICERIGLALGVVVRDAELTHGVSIAELHVTMLDEGHERWAEAVCTITR